VKKNFFHRTRGGPRQDDDTYPKSSFFTSGNKRGHVNNTKTTPLKLYIDDVSQWKEKSSQDVKDLFLVNKSRVP